MAATLATVAAMVAAAAAMVAAEETDRMTTRVGKDLSDVTLETPGESEKSGHIDQVFFNLDAEGFNAFNALRDAPEAANPGLERLMAVKTPWGDQPLKA